MWKKIKAWFIKDDPYWNNTVPDYDISLLEKPYRKPCDTTKLTKQMYDFVIEMKADQEEDNKKYKGDKDRIYETTEDVCTYCNLVFGTNFSRSKLTRIWTGHINREDLPEGITYTIDF